MLLPSLVFLCKQTLFLLNQNKLSYSRDLQILLKKCLLLLKDYPLEVLVSLKDWKKVKDHNGKISWIEARNTQDERTVLILKENTVIFNQANDKSHKLANVEKFVVLKLNSAMLIGEWAQVKTQIEGLVGFVNSTEVWGL